MLVLDSLTAGYGRVEIVRNISFAVNPGQIVGLVAPNGAGKSTLLKAISGLCDVHAGRALYDAGALPATDIGRLSTAERVRAGIRYVPERSETFDHESILGNVRLAALAIDRPWTAEIIDDEIAPLFPILAERRHDAARVLSGGQRRMLSLAMALVQRPRLLLVDEPFAGLAPQVVESLIESLRTLRDKGLGIVVIDHNLSAILTFVDRVVMLKLGELVLDAPCSEVDQERILKVFS